MSRHSQLICILLSNALEYSGGEGEVAIEERCDGVSRADEVSGADTVMEASEHTEFFFDGLYQCWKPRFCLVASWPPWGDRIRASQ